MDSVVLAGQMALAAVFAVAGVGKLIDLEGSRRAMLGFGLPKRNAAIAGTLLPITELTLAVLLVPHATARWAAAAALVLLLAFIAAIARAMSRGEAPDCNCFGALHSAPAGGRALARNVVLGLLAAGLAVRGPGTPLLDWTADRTAAELVAIVTGLATAGLGGAFVWGWRQNRRLSDELAGAQKTIAGIPPGLTFGALAPTFEVPGTDGAVLSLESLLARGRAVVLVFVRPGCGPSETLIATLRPWHDALGDRLTIAVVGAGSVERYRHSPWPMLRDALAHDNGLLEEYDALHELFRAYRLTLTPSAVVLTAQGTIASATVDGRPAIEALVRVTLARATDTRPIVAAGALHRPAAA